jgi:hypothetical protein
MENMRKCYRRHVKGSSLEDLARLVVLDMGGADVNGSYRSVFLHPAVHYITADLHGGNNVSLILDDPYKIPLDDASVDIVLSGQMLEHCEFFWQTFSEMVRILRPGGFIFLIAPSAGPEHRYPVDCYRFYPDAYRALAKWANCRLVETWRDERGPWHDVVGVFAHHELPHPVAIEEEPDQTAPQLDGKPASPEVEVVRGDRSGNDVLADIHRLLKPRFYLEIGVRHGRSLALARCPAVGVDPVPDITMPLASTTIVEPVTSDEFFAEIVPQRPLGPLDLVLIDGMHLFEYALRDFMNVERLAAPHTLVVVDDVFPNHPSQAARRRRTQVWTGDVWKLLACLRKWRPDLYVQPLDTSRTGLMLVAGLDPSNRVLWEQYNPIIRANSVSDELPEDILARRGAISSITNQLMPILEVLTRARGCPIGRAKLVETLRECSKKSSALQEGIIGP